MAHLKIKILIKLEILVLLCQKKLHIKPTTPILWFNIVKCTMFLFSYVLYCNQKEKDCIRRNINIKKRNSYVWNQCHCYYSDLTKIRVGQTLQKIKLPFPNSKLKLPRKLQKKNKLCCRFCSQYISPSLLQIKGERKEKDEMTQSEIFGHCWSWSF